MQLLSLRAVLFTVWPSGAVGTSLILSCFYSRLICRFTNCYRATKFVLLVMEFTICLLDWALSYKSEDMTNMALINGSMLSSLCLHNHSSITSHFPHFLNHWWQRLWHIVLFSEGCPVSAAAVICMFKQYLSGCVIQTEAVWPPIVLRHPPLCEQTSNPLSKKDLWFVVPLKRIQFELIALLRLHLLFCCELPLLVRSNGIYFTELEAALQYLFILSMKW